MKTNIHPDYHEIKVICSCGNTWQTRSNMNKELPVEVCPNRNPVEHGKQRRVDTASRVER